MMTTVLFRIYSPELETTEMSFNSSLVKLTVGRPHRGILLSHRKERAAHTPNSRDDSPGNHDEGKDLLL